MAEASNFVPMTALVRSPATVLQRLADSEEAIVLTRHGRPAAVLLSVEAYARAARDQQVLRMLALGEMEAAAGVGEDLDCVLADAEALLEEN